MREIVIISTVILMTGCASFTRDSDVVMVRQEQKVGIEGGKDVNLVTTTSEHREEKSQSNAGVDVVAAVKAMIDAKNGDVLQAIERFKPKDISLELNDFKKEVLSHMPQPSSGIDGGTAGGLVGAAGGALLFGAREWMARKEAQRRWDEAHKKNIELAREIPPASSKTYEPQDARKET